MNVTRIHRLVKIIGLLQNGRGRDAETLATECKVSRRTIFRDLEALKDSGVPLVFDSHRRHYRIPGPHFLPPTNLTAEEALAIMLLCHELGDDSQLPFCSAARSAAVKLANTLPTRLSDYVHKIAEGVRIRLESTAQLEDQRPVYEQLLVAIAQRQCVRISYDSFTEKKAINTKLNPYRLLFNRRSWYVIGRSSVHRATRTFNLARIGQLESLDETYQIPAKFSLDNYLRNAWSLIPEPGPDHEVLIRFGSLVARNVEEVMWHKTQRSELLEDGTLEFRVTVSGLKEISWWVMGYGDQAEVIEPRELRDLLIERARAMLLRYGDKPSPDLKATRRITKQSR